MSGCHPGSQGTRGRQRWPARGCQGPGPGEPAARLWAACALSCAAEAHAAAAASAGCKGRCGCCRLLVPVVKCSDSSSRQPMSVHQALVGCASLPPPIPGHIYVEASATPPLNATGLLSTIPSAPGPAVAAVLCMKVNMNVCMNKSMHVGMNTCMNVCMQAVRCWRTGHRVHGSRHFDQSQLGTSPCHTCKH